MKAEIKTLTEHGPPWMKIQLRNARSDIAELRREVAELTALTRLPDEVHKRYRASCTRWRAKKQAELNAQWRSLEERERGVDARTGIIPEPLWRDLMLALHPDNAASDKVRARAFDGLRQRQHVLQGTRKG